MWEAFRARRLGRASTTSTAIIDVNRLGQTRETMLGWDLDGYAGRVEAFGWHAIAIDGHDVDAIEAAYAEAEATTGKPTAIIARTKKGKGVKAVEDQPGKHGKPLDDPEEAIAGARRRARPARSTSPSPRRGEPHVFEATGGELPTWELGDEVATRKAYGEALAALGAIRGDVVALDGEVSNSHALRGCSARPTRTATSRCSSRAAAGRRGGRHAGARRWVPFASTFAAFLSRAYDFVRMAAISRADICARRARTPASRSARTARRRWRSRTSRRSARSTARPCCTRRDANQTAKLVAAMADRDGHLVHPHAARQDAGAHGAGRGRPRSAARASSPHDGDDVAIVACGITVDEAVEAAEALEPATASARACSTATRSSRSTPRPSRAAARECGAIVTVEDHWPEGGLGDAVLDALADADDRPPVVKLAVREMPGSGTPEELLHGGRASTPTRSRPRRARWCAAAFPSDGRAGRRDRRRAPAGARCGPRARGPPRLDRLLRPRPEPVRHRRGAQDRDQLGHRRGRAQGARRPTTRCPTTARSSCAPTSTAYGTGSSATSRPRARRASPCSRAARRVCSRRCGCPVRRRAWSRSTTRR